MSLTAILAVIGTVTGTVALAVQIVQAVLDRPRIRLGMGATNTVGEKPKAWLDVHNTGRRPTTLREAGFYAGPLSFATPSVQGIGAFKTPLNAEPFFLEAGQTRRLHGNPDAIDAGFPADHPLRAYAIDQRGRYVWGDAAAVSRWLVGFDPPFVDEPDDFRRLFDDRRGELNPAQVEPRWKLWRRRELRRPEVWRPTDAVRHVDLRYRRSG